MRVSERFAPAAAVVSALGTIACCLPLGIAGALGALGLSVLLETLRPWLLGLAFLLLAVGLFQLYKSRGSCQRRSVLSMVLFTLCAIAVLAVLIFPQQVAGWMAAVR